MYCILSDVVNLILCTLLLYEKLRVVSGVALASGECLLLSPELGVELVQGFFWELQFGAVTGYSCIQKSYVETYNGHGMDATNSLVLTCFHRYVNIPVAA